MGAQEFLRKTVNMLNGYANELNKMESAITAAACSAQAIPNVKEIYKELADVAEECGQTIDYYDQEEPFPAEVRTALIRVQESVRACVHALLLHHIKTKG